MLAMKRPKKTSSAGLKSLRSEELKIVLRIAARTREELLTDLVELRPEAILDWRYRILRTLTGLAEIELQATGLLQREG